MRSTRYRAWDTVTKKFIEIGFHIIGETTCFDLIGQYIEETKHLRDMSKGSILAYNDFEITEWTGLKDKNGKDIYDGDIVKFHTEFKYMTREKAKAHKKAFGSRFSDGYGFGPCIREVTWNPEGKWHPFLEDEFTIDNYCNWLDRDFGFEIIGNKYENPKLLQKELKYDEEN